MKRKNLTSLEEFIDKRFGVKGTKSRAIYDRGFEKFKSNFLKHLAKQKKGQKFRGNTIFQLTFPDGTGEQVTLSFHHHKSLVKT